MNALDAILDPELLAHATDDELAIIAEAATVVQRSEGSWQLQDRQQHAQDVSTDVDELLYGGAVGGGKSDWLLWHHYDLAQRVSGYSGLILRRTFPELRRSLIPRSLERFDHGIARYIRTEFTWRFKNGSTIEFGYLERDQDVYQYQSAEYDCIAWDELTQFPTDFPYRYLQSRCRTTMRKAKLGIRPHIIAGTNPGGVGGNWVKDRFVDPGEWGVPFVATIEIEGQKARKVRRVFVPAKLADNRYIDAEQYRTQLAGLPDATRRALEEGDWDVVEGMFFDTWNRSLHVIEPFDLPTSWHRFGGLDYGYAAPFCHLWLAVDHDRRVYVTGEAYRKKMTPTEQVQLIHKTEGNETRSPTGPTTHPILYRVADPSIWNNHGTGPSIADQYRDASMPCRRANNARIDGWARVRDYLRCADGDRLPGLFVFESCRNLIRTLPMQIIDRDRPEDLDTDGEDHAVDALRYALMSRPPRVHLEAQGPTDPEERLALELKKRHERRRKMKAVGALNRHIQ